MELTDVATHVGSGAGGVLSMGVVAKVLISNWLKNQEEKADKIGDALQVVAVEMAKVGVKLENLQRAADATTKYGEAIAVLQHQVDALSDGINGLGQKVKEYLRNGGA